MPEMRILPTRAREKKEYFVTNLKTAEEAGSPFINDRTAGDSFFGFHPTLEDAVRVFKEEVRKKRPEITDEVLEEMAQKEIKRVRTFERKYDL